MNDWALSGHAKTYVRQGIEFVKDYKESETYLLGKELAEQGCTKGIFQRRGDNAIVVDLTPEGLDEKVVLRGDGTSIYLTQDLAVAKLRYADFQPDEMMYVVADEQNYHFQVLFLCLEKLGILDKKHLIHLGYGLVNLPDGRMKSREGNVIDADNLMDQLHKIAAQKVKEHSTSSSEQEIYTTAEQVQNAAWKFYLLKTIPKKTITFEAEKSIDFHGATGPYLQYAGVRIKSILNKSQLPDTEDWQTLCTHFTEAEKPLGIKVLEWPAVLERAGEHKNPTYIVTYLLELAQTWSSFYAENSIIKAETEELKKARLILAQKIYQVLETGLEILGIEIPEKM
jgi:arginyl-tRNA synthetase